MRSTFKDCDDERVVTDDVVVRSIRDANDSRISKRLDFDGINEKTFQNSQSHYVWMEPDKYKYRSRFLPMRWPDLVLDDMAYRRYRSQSEGRQPHRIAYKSQEEAVDVDEAISKSVPDLRPSGRQVFAPVRPERRSRARSAPRLTNQPNGRPPRPPPRQRRHRRAKSVPRRRCDDWTTIEDYHNYSADLPWHYRRVHQRQR